MSGKRKAIHRVAIHRVAIHRTPCEMTWNKTARGLTNR